MVNIFILIGLWFCRYLILFGVLLFFFNFLLFYLLCVLKENISSKVVFEYFCLFVGGFVFYLYQIVIYILYYCIKCLLYLLFRLRYILVIGLVIFFFFNFEILGLIFYRWYIYMPLEFLSSLIQDGLRLWYYYYEYIYKMLPTGWYHYIQYYDFSGYDKIYPDCPPRFPLFWNWRNKWYYNYKEPFLIWYRADSNFYFPIKTKVKWFYYFFPKRLDLDVFGYYPRNTFSAWLWIAKRNQEKYWLWYMSTYWKYICYLQVLKINYYDYDRFSFAYLYALWSHAKSTFLSSVGESYSFTAALEAHFKFMFPGRYYYFYYQCSDNFSVALDRYYPHLSKMRRRVLTVYRTFIRWHVWYPTSFRRISIAQGFNHFPSRYQPFSLIIFVVSKWYMIKFFLTIWIPYIFYLNWNYIMPYLCSYILARMYYQFIYPFFYWYSISWFLFLWYCVWKIYFYLYLYCLVGIETWLFGLWYQWKLLIITSYTVFSEIPYVYYLNLLKLLSASCQFTYYSYLIYAILFDMLYNLKFGFINFWRCSDPQFFIWKSFYFIWIYVTSFFELFFDYCRVYYADIVSFTHPEARNFFSEKAFIPPQLYLFSDRILAKFSGSSSFIDPVCQFGHLKFRHYRDGLWYLMGYDYNVFMLKLYFHWSFAKFFLFFFVPAMYLHFFVLYCINLCFFTTTVEKLSNYNTQFLWTLFRENLMQVEDSWVDEDHNIYTLHIILINLWSIQRVCFTH